MSTLTTLQSGHVIRFSNGIVADVLKANECRALVKERRSHEVIIGGRVFTASCGAVYSISPNSEVTIIGQKRSAGLAQPAPQRVAQQPLLPL